MASKYTLYKLSGTVDSSGDISETHNSIARGKVEAVYIDYPSNNVEVKVETDEIVNQDIVDLSAANTDTVIYPRAQVSDTNGAGLLNYDDGTNTTDLVERLAVFGKLTLTCSNGTTDDKVTVGVLVEEY